ncbi:MAG: nuclear transport factor 2 family protein [bacterium]
MSAKDHLSEYADGWTKGDPEIILGSVSSDYVFDDPNEGQITKQGFATYMSQLKKIVSTLRGTESEAPFMELSEVVTHEEEDGLTAWCWWAIPGTELSGSGLIKAGPEGVRSERLTYYTRLSS